MVHRLLPLRPRLQSYIIRHSYIITAKDLPKVEPFSKEVYNRITKNSYRQRLNDDFKKIPIVKDYLVARKHATKGSSDKIEAFRNKYSEYGFNENIPFYLYPRFVYLICNSNEEIFYNARAT